MDAERSQEIERLYHIVRELEQSEREALLQKECAGDESLHREVQSMLEALGRAGEFLEVPALEIAAQMARGAGSQRPQSPYRRKARRPSCPEEVCAHGLSFLPA